MRKFGTLLILLALLTPLFLMNTETARANDFPTIVETKKKPRPEPEPTPTPKPTPRPKRIGPQEGGADG